MKIKKIIIFSISIILLGLFSLFCIGVLSTPDPVVNNVANKTTTEDKEYKLYNKNKEKYDYILENSKSYEDLTKEGYKLYIDDLTSNRVKCDDTYNDRIQSLKEQQLDYLNKENKRKKAELNDKYGYIKASDNIEESKKQVSNKISQDLNKSKFANKYTLLVEESFVEVDFKNNINLSSITKGDLTNITRNVYDYFQEAGLAITETELKTISVYIKVGDKKFTSRWTLGQSPEDDWNK